MSNPSHYLILSLSGIGNYLMHSSIFHAIKMHQPSSSLTVWVAPRNTAVLAKANPDIDHVIKAPIKRTVIGHLQQIRKLHRLSADTGLVLYPGQHCKSALYMFLAGLDTRLGHRYLHLGNPDSSLLLTESVAVNPAKHDIDQNLALLAPLNIPVPSSLLPYYVHIPTHYQQQAEALLNRLNRSSVPDKTLVGLHPGCAPDFSWKRWPLDHYSRLAKQLVKQHNAHIIIFGGAIELPMMKKLRRLIGQQHSSIISTHLLTVAAVIKQCNLFIANDSGLMHLASAVSVPTIGLFGPTDEHRTGPRGLNSLALRATGTAPVYDVNTNFSLGSEPHSSLLALSPDQVLEAAAYLLSKVSNT
jgi:heptosyltransferase-2